jgi:mannose-6-phosphate isomerase-like protein (cupin superfamily)
MAGGYKFGTGSLEVSFADFEAQLHAQGFDEVLEKKYPPSAVIDTHVHAFSPKALVVQGEMWLTVDGRTEHLKPGSTFELDAQVPHAERYGAQGTTYWVGRRTP